MSDQLKTVLLVTGSVQACGIYQYADSLFEILKESKNYEFVFVAISNEDQLKSIVEEKNPYAIIYNHNPHTLGWFNNSITRPFKQVKNIRQFVITGHEHINNFIGIEKQILIDPRSQREGIAVPGLPPIKYYDDVVYAPPKGTIKIGTSGFGNRTKQLEQIIDMINDQFDDEVILNIHFPDGAYIDTSGKLGSSIIDRAISKAKSNIKVNVNREFMKKEHLIKWLNANDINLYCYHSAPVPGVSASINHAIAARKPFGVNDCTLLNHVRREYNDLTKTKICDIIDQSPKHLTEFYDAWNSNTVLELYEGLMNEEI
jgi:hypothetical protein